MHYEEHPARRVVADGGIAALVVSARIDEAKERIEEDFCRAFKGDSVMFEDVDARPFGIPHKRRAVEVETNARRNH